MDILVCVKSVPETAEADLRVADDGSGLEVEDLAFGINEWDGYAVEEAVRIKEARGGTVTVVSLGGDDAEDVLRRGLAMGADDAIHVSAEGLAEPDPAVVARAIARAVRGRRFDLVFAGAQSSDLGHGQTGPLLAAQLGLPFATLAVSLELGEGEVVVTRELEAGTHERVRLTLPALVTVQSGINQPRYVSIMGIRKVRSKTIARANAESLGLAESEVGPAAAVYTSRVLALPEAASAAQILRGSLVEVCAAAAKVVREKGGRR